MTFHPRARFRRDPNFRPLCYEIPVLMNFEGVATIEEIGGEPLRQPALLLVYRESGLFHVVIWAHEKMFAVWTFEARYADSYMSKADQWDHRKFCEYVEFLSSWSIGKPITFYRETQFQPVPKFSDKALEVWRTVMPSTDAADFGFMSEAGLH